MARTKQVVIPKFSSEAEEASWWESHRSDIEADIRDRLKQKRPLRLRNLLQGAKPSQPITVRIPKEDLEAARRLAAKKGLGYQTYIKMLLREALPEDSSEHEDDLCSVVEVQKGFQYWLERNSLSGETREAIQKSDLLIFPAEGYLDFMGPLFPTGTEELFQFLQSKAPPGMNVELAVEDADYRELALHADTVRIANILVRLLRAPAAVGLIVEYLKHHLGSRFGKTEVRASIIVDQGDGPSSKTLKISYEGPAGAFEKTMREALSNVCGTRESKSDP
jgi:predicted DNA binding CopG/RHH family protein